MQRARGACFFSAWTGAIAVCAFIFTLACSPPNSPDSGPSDPPPPVVFDGYAITARGGVTDSGSGVLGVALLATIRDQTGAGPSAPWVGGITRDGIPQLTGETWYDAPGSGSYVAWAWPHVAADAASTFELLVGPTAMNTARVPFAAAPPSSVGVPAPRLSADGQRIEWPPVTGAVTYRCTITGIANGYVQQTTVGSATACDMSSLPQGMFMGVIEALSVDLGAIAADPSVTPSVPARFDVGVGNIGVLRRASPEPPLQMLAAGGAVTVGGTSYLATWVSITEPDGTPAPSAWDLSWAEQGTSSGGLWPWGTYPAGVVSTVEVGNFYGNVSYRGRFLLHAWSGMEHMVVPFVVGAPAQLAAPTNVVATGGAAGSATVQWTPVTGARSYLVRAWDPVGYGWVSKLWTGASPLTFPSGTFTPGASYDVYVLAADADVIGGTATTQVGCAETTTAASFTAP